MSCECCRSCMHDKYWNNYCTMENAFQCIINYPRALSQQACNCSMRNGHYASVQNWTRHPIYRRYWEQYDNFKTHFERLINPFPQSEYHCHHTAERTAVSKKCVVALRNDVPKEYLSSKRFHHKKGIVGKPEKKHFQKENVKMAIVPKGKNDEVMQERKRFQLHKFVYEDELEFGPPGEEIFRHLRECRKYETPVKIKRCQFDEERQKELYGENAEKITELERAEDSLFQEFQAMESYSLWPCLPYEV